MRITGPGILVAGELPSTMLELKLSMLFCGHLPIWPCAMLQDRENSRSILASEPPSLLEILSCSHLRDLLRKEDRSDALFHEYGGIVADFSRQRVTMKTIEVQPKPFKQPYLFSL